MGLPRADIGPIVRPGMELSPFGLTPSLRVETVEGPAIHALEDAIRALEARALEPNAFASADFLLAAVRHLPEAAAPSIVAIWRCDGERRLAGLFALRPPAGRHLIRGWSHPFSGFGAPLVDADRPEATMRALLMHLGRGARPAAALCLAEIAVDGPIAAALRRAAAGLGLDCDALSVRRRAALRLPGEDGAAAVLPGKERRRQRRRLAERGALRLRVAEGTEAVRGALETFLALEARGWKGAGGTALLQQPGAAGFARAWLWSAARRGAVRIAELALDGRVIASTIVLTAGDRGFLWKIAYDEAFAAYSPGALLLLDLRPWLIETSGLALVDSCALPGHPLIEPLWRDRIAVAELIVGLRPASAPAYRATLAREHLRLALRRRAKSVYGHIRRMGLLR